MWYVELNGKIIPNPFQRYDDCMAECKRLRNTMVAVLVRPVQIG